MSSTSRLGPPSSVSRPAPAPAEVVRPDAPPASARAVDVLDEVAGHATALARPAGAVVSPSAVRAGTTVAAPLAGRAPASIASDRPKVAELLAGGMRERLHAVGRGEAGVPIAELAAVEADLERWALTPAERARLAELERELVKPGPFDDARQKLWDEKHELEDKRVDDADLVELRRLIVAALPAEVRAGAHEALTAEPPEVHHLLTLLSGELYLPKVSPSLPENVSLAARGQVWLEGTKTPYGHGVEAALGEPALSLPSVTPTAREALQHLLSVYDRAGHSLDMRDPEARLTLLVRLGPKLLHELDGLHGGDGVYFAKQLLVGYVLAKPEGAREVKELLATGSVEALRSLGYAYSSFLRGGNAAAPHPGIGPEALDRLVAALRLDQLGKLFLASYATGDRLSDLLHAEGVDGLIRLARTKTAEELSALAKEARGKDARTFAPAVWPADAELAAKVAAPPIAAVIERVRDFLRGGLDRDDAQELHAIVERHLVPDYLGQTKGGGYSLPELNRFWSDLSVMGPAVLTAEHLALRDTLAALGPQIAGRMMDLLARASRAEIVDQLRAGVKAAAGTADLLAAVGRATQAAAGAFDLEGVFAAKVANPPPRPVLTNSPAKVAELLTTLADAAASPAAIDAALDGTQKPYRSVRSTAHADGALHRVELAIPLGQREFALDLTVRASNLQLRMELPGQSRGSHGSYAILETFGERGARMHFGGPLEGDAPEAALRLGAELFASALALGAKSACEEAKSPSSYAQGQTRRLLGRAALELGRLPPERLGASTGAPSSPLAAFFAVAEAAGYAVEPATPARMAEIGAQALATEVEPLALRLAERGEKAVDVRVAVLNRDLYLRAS